MNTRDKVMGRAALFIVGAVSLGSEVADQVKQAFPSSRRQADDKASSA